MIAAKHIADLKRHIPLAKFDANNVAATLEKLESILRAERARGIAGHWAYDLPRHRGILAIYRAIKKDSLAKTWQNATPPAWASIAARDERFHPLKGCRI